MAISEIWDTIKDIAKDNFSDNHGNDIIKKFNILV